MSQAAKEKAEGMECPECGCPESRVYYTRRRTLRVNGAQVGAIVRRRVCAHCGRSFVTSEKVAGD
jgi:transcriptional regulator NrdR family protein